ncbi:hypothetical protein Tco_0248265 [Tanacetum coccineum]|uniref:Uncharacterized protein n=1 Tax=Tanacetum coccineum TaxID=301880 RepID=A0ABQ4Z2N6_9ASTR
MAKDNALFDHKMALLLVKTQIGVFTSLQHFLKNRDEAISKEYPKTRRHIQEDLHCLFNACRERRANIDLLERARALQKPKGMRQ